MSNNISKSKIIIVTHFLAYSASQALRDFLRKNNCNSLLYVSHPLPGTSTNASERSFAQKSKGKNVENEYHISLRFQNLFLTVLFEFYLTLFWALKTNTRYDVFIGVDNLNTLQGLILRKLNKVEKVVYYTIDYFPTRFENKFINWTYHALDKFCVKHADETWNVSPVMENARKKYNEMIGQAYKKQYVVPIGVWINKTPRKTFSQFDKYKLVFTGHLLPHMGVDLVIKSLVRLKERFPQIKLEIIGSGDEEQKLKKLAKKLNVEDFILFHGWVSDRKKLENILSTAAVGLATFNTDILDDKVKNADPGKIKDYMARGLPVIATNAISTADELEKERCALVISYKEKQFINAVTQLLGNTNLLKEYRKNATNYIRKFDYNAIFTPNINRVLNHKR